MFSFTCILDLIIALISSSRFNGASSKPEGHQSPAVPPIFPSPNPGAAFPATTQAQDLKRTRSPPRALTSYKDALQNSGTATAGRQVTYFFFRIIILRYF